MRFCVALLLALQVASCSSLHEIVLEDIHRGDSVAHVEDMLGKPDVFQFNPDSASGIFYGYKRRRDMCAVSFVNDKVVDTKCEIDTDYVNPWAAMLQGGGQGLQSGAARHQTCTTTGGTGIYTTQCH